MSFTNSNVTIDNLNVYNNTTNLSKVCKKCYQNKPLTEYHKDKSTSDGYRHVFKSCRLNVSKQFRDNNKQISSNRIYTENDVKTCSKCKERKLYTEFV